MERNISVAFEYVDPKALLALPKRACTVNITAQDLAQGERFQACACPVAHAFARRYGLPRWCVTVSNGDLFVRDNSGRVIRWWRMDEAGRGFRLAWDTGCRDIQPVTFRLIPQPVTYMDVTDVLYTEAVAA